MLRILAYAYFAIGFVEFALVPMGKWDLALGIMSGGTSVFFGGVLLGLGIIIDELRALRAERNDTTV